MTHEVILLRGAPGVGKTKTAEQLQRRLARGATIEVDVIRKMINGVSWESHQQHFDAIRAAAQLAKAYRVASYSPVIVVDTLGFGSLQIALEALAPLSASVYSLVCNDRHLMWRLWRRASGFRDRKKGVKFNRHVSTDSINAHHLIDTTWKPPWRVAESIMEMEGLSDGSVS